MVQLLELENGNIIMFNDENIKEEEVIETVEMGEYSSYFIMMTKRQYENVFKSKNSVIKETVI
jgi:ASC-1-like (ASCH) protein